MEIGIGGHDERADGKGLCELIQPLFEFFNMLLQLLIFLNRCLSRLLLPFQFLLCCCCLCLCLESTLQVVISCQVSCVELELQIFLPGLPGFQLNSQFC
jgi:hypothetical protein